MAIRDRRNRCDFGPVPWIAATGLALAGALAATVPAARSLLERDRRAGPGPARTGPRAPGTAGHAGGGGTSRAVDPAVEDRAVDPAAWREAFERLRAAEADGQVSGDPSGPWLAAMDARWARVEGRLAAMAGADAARARAHVARAREAVRAGLGTSGEVGR